MCRSPTDPVAAPADLTVGPDPRTSQFRRLRFNDANVEAGFRADYFARSASGVRINMALGALLFGLWALVDRAVMPQALWFTVPVRFGVVCPVMIGVFLLSFTGRFERSMVPALMLVDFLCGSAMIAIIIVSGPDGHRYYFPGLILTVLGCCACPGLRFRAAVAVTLAIALAYVAMLCSTVTSQVALINAMFLATSQSLAMSISYTLEHQQRSAFSQRWVIREQAEALRLLLIESNRAARTDPLTGLSNRRHFFDEAARRRGQVSVIILDIDHFKSINDQYGHSAGDRVLGELARRVEAAIRPGDVPCRYGGEEFAVLLRGTDLVTAAAVGERVRRDVESMPFDASTVTIPVTISVGVATITDDASCIESLIDSADQALYAAKNAGRNRVRLGIDSDIRIVPSSPTFKTRP